MASICSSQEDIRAFHPSDLPAMYSVCLHTGDSGRDASAHYEDPFLLGHVYCGPYPVADPGLTFIAQDEKGVVGYIVGTADTRAFEQWRRVSWYPTLRATYPDPNALGPLEHERIVDEIGSDALTDDDALLEGYPAHLHIDLLPRAQHKGLGRALTNRLWTALRERGVPGVHLGVGAGNPSARAFYLAMGYTEFRAEDWGSTMVKQLS